MTDYRCIFLLLMLAGLPASHADAAAAEKPNFIIYMSDDIGYDPFGCAGNEYAKTPHRDLSSSVPEKLTAALYNLKDDIAEAKNLAESHGKKTQSMSDLLENWGLETSRTAAPFPILKKPG